MAGDGGLNRESWAKCDQPMTLERSQAAYPPLGNLSAESLTRVEVALKQALELP
jgi:hypothetical protein